MLTTLCGMSEGVLMTLCVLAEGVFVFVLLIGMPMFLISIHTDKLLWPYLPRIPDLLSERQEHEADLNVLNHDVIEQKASKGGWTVRHVYTAVFRLATGEIRRFAISRRTYDRLYYPARGSIRCKGKWLISFDVMGGESKKE